MFRRRKKIRL